ncbi:MAG: hypothetical protein FGM15_12245 [Chthoniobacterales bacterium]|nr:hypothetical protein [Chthoniobacterales bacterium]
MRWLLDQGIPRSVVGLLATSGHNALHVADIGMSSASDSLILQKAAEEQRIVVTLDADFHALLADSLATGPSVIRIRDEGLKGPQVADVIVGLAERFGEELDGGCAMTIRNGRLRYRGLPLS